MHFNLDLNVRALLLSSLATWKFNREVALLEIEGKSLFNLDDTFNGVMINVMSESRSDQEVGIWDAWAVVEEGQFVVTGNEFPGGGGNSIKAKFNSELEMVGLEVVKGVYGMSNTVEDTLVLMNDLKIESVFVEPRDPEIQERLLAEFPGVFTVAE